MTLLEAWQTSPTGYAYYTYHNLVIVVACTCEEYLTLRMGNSEPLRFTSEDFIVYLRLLRIDATEGWSPVK